MKHALVAGLALAVLLAALAPPAEAQTQKSDRVVLKERAPAEGRITKESPTEITIVLDNGRTDRIKVADVARIEYYDQPTAFGGLYAALDEMRYNDALSALSSAEDQVKRILESDDAKIKRTAPRKWWFDPALCYYRGVCFKEIKEWNKAVGQLSELIDKHGQSRFVAEGLMLKAEAHLGAGDTEGFEKTLAEMRKRSSDLGRHLSLRAELMKAQKLLDDGKASDAHKAFEALAMGGDASIKDEAVTGVILCLVEMKDTARLNRYCESVIRTSRENGPRLVASNALADSFFTGKDYEQARQHYVNSVVLYNPGRGSDLTNDHARAIYRLARCYEELMGAAKKAKNRTQELSWAVMALNTYRELSIEYASSTHRDEAVAAATKLEREVEKLQEAEGKGDGS